MIRSESSHTDGERKMAHQSTSCSPKPQLGQNHNWARTTAGGGGGCLRNINENVFPATFSEVVKDVSVIPVVFYGICNWNNFPLEMISVKQPNRDWSISLSVRLSGPVAVSQA